MALGRQVELAAAAVGIAGLVAQAAEPYDHRVAVAEDLLEGLLGIRPRREAQLAADRLGEGRQVIGGAVGDVAVVEDSLQGRLEQRPRHGDRAFGVRRAPLERAGPGVADRLGVQPRGRARDQLVDRTFILAVQRVEHRVDEFVGRVAAQLPRARAGRHRAQLSPHEIRGPQSCEQRAGGTLGDGVAEQALMSVAVVLERSPASGLVVIAIA